MLKDGEGKKRTRLAGEAIAHNLNESYKSPFDMAKNTTL